MNVVPMHKSNPYCWALMPQMLESIMKFSHDHTAGGTDACADRWSAAFGLGSNEMLGLAIVPDDSCQLAGHVICGVETYLGETVCMVYQFEKKDGSEDDWRELNKSIQVIIDNWCHNLGLKEIMAMAETRSRGRLFRQFGYNEGPVLMRRRFE